MSKSRALFLLLALALLAGGLWWFARQRGGAPAVARERADAARDAALGSVPDPKADDAAVEHAAPSGDIARAPIAPATPIAAALAGRLLDAHTGEGVPWYTVQVRSQGIDRTEFETDARGAFATSERLEAGRLTFKLVDVEGQPPTASSADTYLQLDHDPAGGPRDVRALVGPTYTLEVELPEGRGPDGFRAALFLDPPEHGDDDSGPRRSETVVRAGRAGSAALWVRFRELQREGDPLWLSLRSVDGAWSGGARVPGGYGVHGEPVRIELAPRGVVTGRYVARSAAHERRGGALALFRVDRQTAGPRWECADPDGAFRIADLDPGAYRLEVRDEAWRAAPVSFELPRGELDLGELAWDPIPIAGRVLLHVHSAVEVPIDVELVRRDDPPRSPPWHSDEWEEQPDGTFISAFEWDEVYAGDYDIEVHSHDTTSWHVALGRLTPPVDELVLELPAPAPTLRFEVLDAHTGAAPAEWSLLVRQEHGWEELDGSPSALDSVVWEADAAVAVISPGYQTWVSTAADLARRPQGEQLVSVRLRPGWSRLYVAHTRAHGRRVAGAEIWLDGALAGATNGAGELWVHRATPPSALEVRHPTLVWTKRAEEDAGALVWVALRP